MLLRETLTSLYSHVIVRPPTQPPPRERGEEAGDLP